MTGSSQLFLTIGYDNPALQLVCYLHLQTAQCPRRILASITTRGAVYISDETNSPYVLSPKADICQNSDVISEPWRRVLEPGRDPVEAVAVQCDTAPLVAVLCFGGGGGTCFLVSALHWVTEHCVTLGINITSLARH